jgi:excisionase family DNA binding protein
MTSDFPDLLTVPQAAAALGLQPSRVRQLIRAGELVARSLGSRYVIRRADLTDYQSRRRRPGWPKGKPRRETDPRVTG